jgi:hypothetical protein
VVPLGGAKWSTLGLLVRAIGALVVFTDVASVVKSVPLALTYVTCLRRVKAATYISVPIGLHRHELSKEVVYNRVKSQHRIHYRHWDTYPHLFAFSKKP